MTGNEKFKVKNSYIKNLAIDDPDFLRRREIRGARLMLEYEKPELQLQDHRVVSTVVAFGSARVKSEEQLEQMRKEATTDAHWQEIALREKQVCWYDMAREFGRFCSLHGGALKPNEKGELENVIATGGGPGLMEAANRGAHDVGAPSVSFTIQLPFEEEPNPYSSEDLTFKFQYFGIRKMHLTIRAAALGVFPGGFGTLDEAAEILNLMSTQKMPKIPIVFFDQAFWEEVLNVPALVKHGMISQSALELIHYANSAQEGWDKMVQHGLHIG